MKITFITIPKPFEMPNLVPQLNAIRSWNQLQVEHQILLYVDKISELDIPGIQIPVTNSTKYGTPYLNTVLEDAQDRATDSDFICFVNTDIILTTPFAKALNKIPKGAVGVSRRLGLDLKNELNNQFTFTNESMKELQEKFGESLIVYGGNYLDIFLIPTMALPRPFPDFIVGRPIWDNWLLFNFYAKGLMIVDFSDLACVYHQEHNYNHIPQKTGARWEGPESTHNVSVAKAHMKQGANLELLSQINVTVAQSRIDTMECLNSSNWFLNIKNRLRYLPLKYPWTESVISRIQRFYSILKNLTSRLF